MIPETGSVWLSFGSNIEPRQDYIEKAMALLQQDPALDLVARSSFYFTEPLLDDSLQPFINAAAQFNSSMDPGQLLMLIQHIESTLGRKNKIQGTNQSDQKRSYQNRTIDIDIIFWDNREIQDDQLIIPHPGYSKRKFVLYPLREIALNYKMQNFYDFIHICIENCPDMTEPKMI